MGKFSLRLITGIILIAVALFLTYKGDFYFFILIFIFLFFALYEFLRILYNSGYIIKPYIVFILNLLFFPSLIYLEKHRIYLTVFLILIFFLISLLLAEKRKGFTFFTSSVSSTVYLVLPSFLIYELRNIYGFKEILFLFGTVWVFDSFSYFSGKFLGKRRLWERVSHNKTVEGVIGGLLFAIIFSILFSLIIKEDYFKRIIFSTLISLSALLGDLWESMFKREMGIKDSSNLIPGHGGFLDRIDSLLIAILFYFPFLKLIG